MNGATINQGTRDIYRKEGEIYEYMHKKGTFCNLSQNTKFLTPHRNNAVV